jgi:CRISPR-associated protein Cas4
MIHVSDLSRFVYCPRAVYLANVLKVEAPATPQMGRGVIGHAVRRELSMRQAKLVSKMMSVTDIDSMLRLELDAVLADLPHIFAQDWPDGYDSYVPELKRELSAELDMLADDLTAMVEDMGFDKALSYVTPWRTEYGVKSESLNLAGRVDKVMRADAIVPVEIKTGRVADRTFEGDRIQLCAYGMLLEERFGQYIPHGVVEYTRNQERRPVLFTEKLRRQVITTRDELTRVLDGLEPQVCPHGQPMKCESCGLKEKCYLI